MSNSNDLLPAFKDEFDGKLLLESYTPFYESPEPSVYFSVQLVCMHSENVWCYEVWLAQKISSFTYVYLVSNIIRIILHAEVKVYIFSRAVLMRIILLNPK